ncbi:MAG: MFS transporter [bacterium]|nr:MFS transporter [bacterium]
MTQRHTGWISCIHLPSHTPFAPSRSPVFYGWIILLVGAGGIVMSSPGQTIGVSAFIDLLVRDLGVSPSNLSLAYLIGTLASSFTLSYAGIVYDRCGARLMGTIVAAALGSVLLGLSLIPEIVSFLHDLSSGLRTAPTTFVLLSLGFFLLRFFGQGALTLVSRNMVLKWFERRRGFANAIVGAAATLGFSASPLIFNRMIDQWGWQTTWRLLGIIIALPFAVVFLLLARDNPHECGLLPDGGVSPQRHSDAPETRPSANFTLRQAQKTLPFWIFLGIITVASMYLTGLTFNIISIFEEVGRSRTQAISIFLPSSIIALSLNLGAGWLCDRIRFKYLVMLQGLGILISTIALLFLGEPGMLALLIIGRGINSGMFGLAIAVPWPRFFGLTHLGRISGFVVGWAVAGSALGPYAFSLCLDLFGSYRGVSILTAAIVSGLMFFTPFTDRPKAP